MVLGRLEIKMELNELIIKFDKALQHLKSRNLNFATEMLEEISSELRLLNLDITSSMIVTETEQFYMVKKLIELKYGSSDSFCFGLALLLHDIGQFKDAEKMFTICCKELENGTKKKHTAN